jgi:hypothetical protein
MIGEMNIQVTFKPYTLVAVLNGGTDKTPETPYSEWVKVEQISGSRRLENAQITFAKAFKITKRHFESRPIEPDLVEIDYNDLSLSVADVKAIKDGRNWYDEILCYSSNKAGSNFS